MTIKKIQNSEASVRYPFARAVTDSPLQRLLLLLVQLATQQKHRANCPMMNL